MSDKNYGSGMKLKIGENSIEIFGSEKFVNENFKELKKEIINIDIKNMNVGSIKEYENNNKVLDKNIFDVMQDGTVNIIADIDIENKKKSTTQYTILHLYAAGDDGIKKNEIISLLGKYRALDGKNFSGHMKSVKKFISIDNENNMSLTYPGQKEAEKIIEKLNGK